MPSSIIGESHMLKKCDGGKPFTVGQVEPSKGFIHVFDDMTLPLILKQLDTISDFVAYLEKKENLFTSSRTVTAKGEEDVLAHYLMRTNEESKHDFVLPDGVGTVSFVNGAWQEFTNHYQRRLQIEADKVSYLWDETIEKFAHHALNGTLIRQSKPGFQPHEAVLRVLAGESRLGRRLLSSALMGLVEKTNSTGNLRATRIVQTSLPNSTLYFFFAFPQREGQSLESYREERGILLQDYIYSLKYDLPDVTQIVGLATESGFVPERSEDLVYFDASDWTDEDREEARKIKEHLVKEGFLKKRTPSAMSIQEYPNSPTEVGFNPQQIVMDGNNRNKPCPCGSGKKLKKCHGRQM